MRVGCCFNIIYLTYEQNYEDSKRCVGEKLHWSLVRNKKMIIKVDGVNQRGTRQICRLSHHNDLPPRPRAPESEDLARPAMSSLLIAYFLGGYIRHRDVIGLVGHYPLFLPCFGRNSLTPAHLPAFVFISSTQHRSSTG